MRRLIISAFTMLLASTAMAWDFSGSNQTTLWASQADSGHAFDVLQYKEYCDLRLAGTIKQDVGLEAGLRFLADQETWDDQPLFTGFSKRYLQVKTDFLSARVGTYYATLGRGLVLNCANEQTAKIDRDLEGALVSAWADELGEARLLLGRIRENTREMDSTRTYFGGEAKLTRFSPATLGLAYLRANAAGASSDPSFGKPAGELYSGSLAGGLGPIDLYGEYAGRRTYGRLFPSAGWMGIPDVNGHAFYASVSAAFSGLGLMMDAKDYRDFDAAINAPPPCNREGRLLNNGLDEYGFQADLTATPWTGLELRGNGSWAKTRDQRNDVIGSDGRVFPGAQKYQDLFAEARWEISPAVTLNGEARLRKENNLQPDIIIKKYKGATAGLNWKYAQSQTLSFKAGGNIFNNVYKPEDLGNGLARLEDLNYDLAQIELGWVPDSRLNFFASAELADRKVSEYDGQKQWGEAGCTVDFNQGRQHLKLSAGRTKGGLVCSGGFCRWEPAFKGFKAVWDWKF